MNPSPQASDSQDTPRFLTEAHYLALRQDIKQTNSRLESSLTSLQAEVERHKARSSWLFGLSFLSLVLGFALLFGMLYPIRQSIGATSTTTPSIDVDAYKRLQALEAQLKAVNETLPDNLATQVQFNRDQVLQQSEELKQIQTYSSELKGLSKTIAEQTLTVQSLSERITQLERQVQQAPPSSPATTIMSEDQFPSQPPTFVTPAQP